MKTWFMALLGMTIGGTVHARDTKPYRDHGVELQVATGMDGCARGDCEYLGAMVYTRFDGLYRIFPYLSAGVQLNVLFYSPMFAWADSRTALYDVFLGPQVRGILPLKKLDLWAGFAFGYHHRHRKIDSDGYIIENRGNGMGIAWALGAEYFFNEHMALGGDVWFYKAWNFEYCSKAGDGDELCSGKDGIDETSGLNISAGVTFTILIPIKKRGKK
jgi:opacity protein-like surface antigen